MFDSTAEGAAMKKARQDPPPTEDDDGQWRAKAARFARWAQRPSVRARACLCALGLVIVTLTARRSMAGH